MQTSFFFAVVLISIFVTLGVIRSCKQVSRSKRLRTLLELVLCLGNYMNKGSRGNASGERHCTLYYILHQVFAIFSRRPFNLWFYMSGFRVSSLNKIIDTKSSADRRITLLHYILELLQQKVRIRSQNCFLDF